MSDFFPTPPSHFFPKKELLQKKNLNGFDKAWLFCSAIALRVVSFQERRNTRGATFLCQKKPMPTNEAYIYFRQAKRFHRWLGTVLAELEKQNGLHVIKGIFRSDQKAWDDVIARAGIVFSDSEPDNMLSHVFICPLHLKR